MMLWNNEKKDDIIMKCPKERSTKMGRIIAIANQKGGVGKTTTAINLSASLASLGKKVLAIDMDPQGNMSSGLGVDKNEVEKTVYDLIIGNIGIEECIYEEVIENLDVLPSNIDLSAAEIELIGVDNKEYILRDEVNKVKEKYDFIIIDCPPALSMLTINAMTTSDSVLVPIQCEYYALEGLGQLINTIGLVQEHFNPVLLVSTMLVTMFDRRTLLSREVYNEVKGHYPSIVLNTTIPRSVKISEAPSFSQSVIAYDPRGIGAISYGEAALEIAQRSQQVLDTIDARRNK